MSTKERNAGAVELAEGGKFLLKRAKNVLTLDLLCVIMYTMIKNNTMNIKPNSIVELPSGFIARVVYIIDEMATCRWIGSPLHFTCPLNSLRFLGEDTGPVPTPEIDLDGLITERNVQAIEYAVQRHTQKRGPGRAKKELTLLERLDRAKNDPEEFKRLLELNGLIPKNP